MINNNSNGAKSLMLQQLKSSLLRDEGYRKMPYRCTEGKETIGVGFNLDAIRENGMSEKFADHILEYQIVEATQEVGKIFSEFNKPEVGWNGEVMLVVVNMMFCMGPAKFKTFKKFIKAVKAGHFHKAADEIMDSHWARVQAPKRAERLSRQIRCAGLEREELVEVFNVTRERGLHKGAFGKDGKAIYNPPKELTRDGEDAQKRIGNIIGSTPPESKDD
jgi:lysozyme